MDLGGFERVSKGRAGYGTVWHGLGGFFGTVWQGMAEYDYQTFRAEESDEEFFEKKKNPKKKFFSSEEFFIGKK